MIAHALGGAVAWTPTSLPAGMSLSPTGVLSGIPTTPGNNQNIDFTLNDGTDNLPFRRSLNVSAIQITTPGMLPNATQNTFYSTTVAASGGTNSITFQANCCLPNGLSMNAAARSRAPRTPIPASTADIVATDSNNVSYRKRMSIVLIGAPPKLPELLPCGTVIDDCTVYVLATRASTSSMAEPGRSHGPRAVSRRACSSERAAARPSGSRRVTWSCGARRRRSATATFSSR
jgi:hypothetical protein